MTVLIADAAVRAHYTMRDCVVAVEQAFASAGGDGFEVSERKVVAVENVARLLSLTAASSELSTLVAHVYSGAPAGRDKRNSTVDQRQKLYLVFDAISGACEAIVAGDHLSWLKTGAMGAVAINHLSDPSASRLAVIGSGRQARAALAGAMEVRNFTDIRVWSRTSENAELMVSEFPGLPGLTTVASAQEAVEGAHVVITATTSRVPVISGNWLARGVHVNSIGAHYPHHREIDGEGIRRSSVIVDSRLAARVEKGELIIAENQGVFNFDEIIGELGQIISGAVPWGRSDGENTLFASCGSAIESLGAVVGVLAAIPPAERSAFEF